MKNPIVSIELIENRIHIIRGQRAMLDKDLAVLYGVTTKNLNKAVSRNPKRFPEDFAFQLSKEEWNNLRFQIGTSSLNYGGRRYSPYAFTEQGVAMLSSVLRSPQAAEVNVEIMRVFVRLRHIAESTKELAKAVFELRSFALKNENRNDQEFRKVWNAIEKLSEKPSNDEAMGFRLR